MKEVFGRTVVSAWGEYGEIVVWEPLSSAMCDTRVRIGDNEVWFAMADLRPTDGLGPLPSRTEAREEARLEAIRSLEAIREQHVRDFDKPWPGCEYGKVIVGCVIDAALTDLKNKRRS